MKKKVFVFVYGDISLGGVEVILSRLIRQLLIEGYRIIWLSTGKQLVDQSFQDVFTPDKLDIYDVNLGNDALNKDLNLNLNDNDEVVAFAFDMLSFISLEFIKKYQNRYTKINTFLFITHFQGLFFEKRVKKFQNVIKIFSKMLVKFMIKNRNLLFANISHIDSFQANYNIKIEDKSGYLFHDNYDYIDFDGDKISRKLDNQYFNIITITRFDFPHKSYIFGLIKTFADLRKKYKMLTLTIIGYGNGENQVKEYIGNLDTDSRNSIFLYGKVPYDNLNYYFDISHLNIGVASTIIDGALAGVISIPVRHYSETCDAYGFLPYSRDYIVSEQPGSPVKDFIEKVLSSSKSEFISLSKDSYNTFASKKKSELLPYKNVHVNSIFMKFVLLSYKFYKLL